MTERWASMAGWLPDPDRPGYFIHLDYERPVGGSPARRDAEGRWYSRADIDAKKTTTEPETTVQLEGGDWRTELQRRFG